MRLIKRSKPKKSDFSSPDYWRERYENGRTSGAGSYGRLAQHKAEVINTLVADKEIASVIEFGSGDGNQASLLDIPVYKGIDVSPLVISEAQKRFADRQGWSFSVAGTEELTPRSFAMSMSLDVIYHLIEDEIFDRYMADLVSVADRYVLIYSSNHDAQTRNSHVRHRAYSEWMAQHCPDWTIAAEIPQPYPMTEDSDPNETSFASFRLYERAAS